MKVKLQENETACFDCGWYDKDKSFFTEEKGEMYCSLHLPSKTMGTCGDCLAPLAECVHGYYLR